MVDVTTEERFIGVDFHKQTLVVARLRRDGSRCEKTQHTRRLAFISGELHGIRSRGR